jgi:HSP20 family protein
VALAKRKTRHLAALVDDFFGRRSGYFPGPMLIWPEAMDRLLRVAEYQEDGMTVIKADVAGIDPAKDIEVSVSDNTLHIALERREGEQTKSYVRRELGYGSVRRDLPLPQGVSEVDITATYRDGVLEIRAPTLAIPMTETRTIPITAG